MNSKAISVFLLAVILVACESKSCDIFHNVQAMIYTGSPKDPQNVKLNGLEDLKDAYNVQIENQFIPELCKGAIQDLPKLDRLVIKNCHISKIESGAFENVPSLRVLDLSGNAINKIPKTFKGLSVRRLNLTQNKVEEIDEEAFDAMPQLQVIDLTQNKIKEINPNWFKDSPKVYRIILDYNKISRIPNNCFKNLDENSREHPFELWMNNNKLEKIQPSAFKGISKIESLWLSNNEITQLDENCFKNCEFNNIQLDYNKLTCIDDSLLNKLNVKEINIDNNPLDCDCLRKIRKWGQKKGVELKTIRRSFACMRDKIDDVLVSQKKYYEEKIDHLQRKEEIDPDY